MGDRGDRLEVDPVVTGHGETQGARTRGPDDLDVVDRQAERDDGRLDGGAYRFELRVRRTHSPCLPCDPKKKRGPRPTFTAPIGAPNTTVEV